MVAATLRATEMCEGSGKNGSCYLARGMSEGRGKNGSCYPAWGTEMCEGRGRVEFTTNCTNLLFQGWARMTERCEGSKRE